MVMSCDGAESFEDEATAAPMECRFRASESIGERPDIDAIYATLPSAMTRQGGWPTTLSCRRRCAVLVRHLLPLHPRGDQPIVPAGAHRDHRSMDAAPR